MAQLPVDPAPRSYPPFVSLLRRSARRWGGVGSVVGFEAIEAWLLGNAAAEDDTLPCFEELVWRLVTAGLPLDRASLHVGTLHPQVYGFAWNWNAADGFCDEVKVSEEALQSDAYRRNPLFGVIERGQAYQGTTTDPEAVARYPLMAELAKQGIVEYLALPLRAGGRYHNAATVATAHEGGFSGAQLAALQRVLKLFALHVERQIQRRIAGNVLDTYLGAAAGGRVLDGLIKRGAGEPIRSVIWVSDLRGFTDLSERLSGPDMIALLNAYFGCLAGAVLDHAGEVLKFIGDGLLAVFPFETFRDGAGGGTGRSCCSRAGLRRPRPTERCAASGDRGHRGLASAAHRDRLARRRSVLRQCRRTRPARLHRDRPRRQRGESGRSAQQVAWPSDPDHRDGGRPSRPGRSTISGAIPCAVSRSR
jgi:adenylate cyclase